MTINRNNYEDYFLRYADQELSPAEKKLVEQFVRLSTDLEEEFIMLQQSIFQPDPSIQFEDKSKLFRTSESFINQSNQAELFILYHDNELTGRMRSDIEACVAREHLEKEFSLFGLLKADPDSSVVFPNKELLYKKSTSVVIPLAWKRIAAAVIAALGIWMMIGYFQTNKGLLAVGTFITISKGGASNAKNVIASVRIKNKQIPQIYLNKQVSSGLKGALVVNKTGPAINQNEIFKRSIESGKPSAIPDVNNSKDVVIVVPNSINYSSDSGPVPSGLGAIDAQPLQDKTAAALGMVQNTELRSDILHQTSYDMDPDPGNENYVFYNVTEEKFKRSKLGGFLRKVQRAVSRKNPLSNFKNQLAVSEN